MLPPTMTELETLRLLERRIESGELSLGDQARTARELAIIKAEIAFELRALSRL